MESISQIINKLRIQHETGASAADLLNTTEELRMHLVPAVMAEMNIAVSGSVSVILPAGKLQGLSASVNKPTASEAGTVSNTFSSTVAVPEASYGVTEKVPAKELAAAVEIEEVAPSFIYTAPRPPAVPAVAAMGEDLSAREPEQPARVKPLTLWDVPQTVPTEEATIVPPEEAAAPQPVEPNAPSPFFSGTSNHAFSHDADEAPIIFELNVPEDWHPLQETAQQNHSIPEGFLKFSPTQPVVREVVSETARPKELHEILAARVVATPAHGEPEKPANLAEKIGGGKITDLKKGIGINDRFRLINSLFRGDEVLFERAVKTVNNFTVLQEAMYWIQRELVIKYGWNEEDELVQSFFQLVKRRFL